MSLFSGSSAPLSPLLRTGHEAHDEGPSAHIARLPVLEETNLHNQLVFIRNSISHLANSAEHCSRYSFERAGETEQKQKSGATTRIRQVRYLPEAQNLRRSQILSNLERSYFNGIIFKI